MATLYATKGKTAPRIAPGMTVVHSSYTSPAGAGGTASSGDVVVVCRIPSGAKVVDVVFYPGTIASAVAQVGISGSAAAFISGTASVGGTVMRMTSQSPNLMWKFSASDEATQRYTEMIFTPGATLTMYSAGALWFDCVVQYIVD